MHEESGWSRSNWWEKLCTGVWIKQRAVKSKKIFRVTWARLVWKLPCFLLIRANSLVVGWTTGWRLIAREQFPGAAARILQDLRHGHDRRRFSTPAISISELLPWATFFAVFPMDSCGFHEKHPGFDGFWCSFITSSSQIHSPNANINPPGTLDHFEHFDLHLAQARRATLGTVPTLVEDQDPPTPVAHRREKTWGFSAEPQDDAEDEDCQGQRAAALPALRQLSKTSVASSSARWKQPESALECFGRSWHLGGLHAGQPQDSWDLWMFT